MKRTKFLNALIFLAISFTNCSKSTKQESNTHSLGSNSSKVENVSDTIKTVNDLQESDNSTQKSSQTDSVELTQLIRQVYTWRAHNKMDDFPYEFDNSSLNIFIGIDWNLYDERVKELMKTNFFSDDFFVNHKTMALSLDSSIRKAGIEWRNIQDGIPIWSTNADDWCNCQDHPDKYWKILTIMDLELEKELATFYWTWDSGPTNYPHNYNVTAKRTNQGWKISTLEGFKYYRSAKYYDDIINGNNGD